MAIMRINAFIEQHHNIDGVNEIENVYQSRVYQLKRLRDLKSYDRLEMERRGEANYNAKKLERERKAKEQMEYLYRLAVEARRTAEAIYRLWSNAW